MSEHRSRRRSSEHRSRRRSSEHRSRRRSSEHRSRRQSSEHRSRRQSSEHRRRTRSQRRTAGDDLEFSVAHLQRLLSEGHYAQRVTWSAPTYLAAVIQYLTAMILELAGNEAQRIGCRRITPELLDMAIHNNALLSSFFHFTTISQVARGRQ